MIGSDEDLAFMREQLGRIEAALEDLKRDVRPKSEKWFQLMSEAYVDEIAKLRREIEDYRAGRGTFAHSGSNRVRTARRRPA